MSPPLIPEATSVVFRRQRLAKLRKSLENGYTLPATGVSPSLSPSFPFHLSRKGKLLIQGTWKIPYKRYLIIEYIWGKKCYWI